MSGLFALADLVEDGKQKILVYLFQSVNVRCSQGNVACAYIAKYWVGTPVDPHVAP